MNFKFYFNNPTEIFRTIRVKRNKRVIHKKVAEFKSLYPSEYVFFEKALIKYHDGGGFQYGSKLQIYKLIEIHQFLDKFKIKSILELGTGATTTVINQYLLKYEDVRAVCLDESEYWLKNTINILQNLSEISTNLQLVHAQRIIENQNPLITRYDYDYSSDHNFELVIVDGPSTEFMENWSPENWNSDLLTLSSYRLPNYILIDNRKSTFKNTLDKLKDKYHVNETHTWHTRSKIYSSNNINYYTQLILRDMSS